ncbi:multidrug effflux MFS transporter [Caballeronia sp. dw_19]|uniref:multidrug effflux MFS transporter n=1 Tax=Caballeronia sp. dw_19 TaxID=2719791 RepID=UPI001BD2FF8D
MTQRWRLAPQSILFAVFLGALAALPPISIDMALPALGNIANALDASASQAGLTLSLFMAGFAVGPIAYGPLSDARGRKPTLLLGLALFTVGGIVSALAPGIAVLLGARLVQGIGAGAGMTIALAIVRDLFEGNAMQHRLAAITVVANVAPIVAPSIGVGLLAAIEWRGIYGVMAACGLLAALATWAGLTESAPQQSGGFALSGLRDGYRRALTHRAVIGHILINGFGFGWMFAYVAGSPLVLLHILHVRPIIYAAMFAMTGAGIVAGATVNGFIAAGGVESRRILATAICTTLAATFGLIALSVLHQASLPTVMPLLVVSTFCFGLAAPSAARGALDPIPELAGVAGGLLTSIQMLCGAASSSFVALLFPILGIFAMSGVMAACALLAGMVWIWLGKRDGIESPSADVDANSTSPV